MKITRSALACPWALTSVGGCSPQSEATTPVPLEIAFDMGDGAVPGMTDHVKADGSVVTIEVSGATAGPIRVTASRGTFENLIMGRLIPAGTGLSAYKKLTVAIDQEAEAEAIAHHAAVRAAMPPPVEPVVIPLED